MAESNAPFAEAVTKRAECSRRHANGPQARGPDRRGLGDLRSIGRSATALGARRAGKVKMTNAFETLGGVLGVELIICNSCGSEVSASVEGPNG